MSPLTAKALEIAASQVGVRETKRNRGPEIDAYLLAAGLDPTKGSYPWCAAFVYWCYNRAALELRTPNPSPRTASVMKLWAKAERWRTREPAEGAVFIIDHGGGRGHCGFVEWAGPLHVITVEGNTNDGGSREGDGVYRRTRRRDEVTGYIDYARPEERVA